MTEQRATNRQFRSPIEDRKPGDLIFYYSGNSHVGIYIGNDKVVHASNSAPYPKGGIKISTYDYVYIYGCVRYLGIKKLKSIKKENRENV